MSILSYYGQIIIIAAPSGAGKTSLVKALLEKIPELRLSISHTTRQKRSSEVDGQHYWFVNEQEFEHKIRAGDFLEYARVFDHYYGTCHGTLLQQLAQDHDVILEIDWQGAQIVRQHYPQATSIFILPPAIASLRERLYKRSQDDFVTIEKRLQEAHSEIRHADEFEYLIVNDDFNQALADLIHIVMAGRLKTVRQKLRYQQLFDDLLNEA